MVQYILKEYMPMAPALYFIKSWGGTLPPFQKSSTVCWFGYFISSDYIDSTTYSKIPLADDIPIPMSSKLGRNYFYTSVFNHDSLLKLKELVTYQQNLPPKDSLERQRLQKIITDRFNLYKQSVAKEHPYIFYIKARLFYLEMLLSPTQGDMVMNSARQDGLFPFINTVINSTGLKMLNKLTTPFFYLVLFLAFLAIPKVLYYGLRKDFLAMLIVAPVFNLLGPTLLRNLDESRFLMPEWPFIIGCAAYIISLTFEFFEKRIKGNNVKSSV